LRNWYDFETVPDLSEVFELLSEKDIYAPVLRHLNLGWKQIKDPNQANMVLHEHPPITREKAKELLETCRAAGVEMIMRVLPPQPKIVTWYWDTGSSLREHKIKRWFHWPYDGYEECCKEHACDLETGFPVDG